MLIIGCPKNSGFTVAEAPSTLLSNSRGSTRTLAVAESCLPMGVFCSADAVVHGSLLRVVTDNPSQQEA